MRSLLLRILIISISGLIALTWFPYSLIPLWIMLLTTHFFSMREGAISLAGFSLIGLLFNLAFPFFFLLWACFIMSIFIKMLSPNGKMTIVQFVFLCLLTSVIAQFIFYRTPFTIGFMTTFRHLLFIIVLILPAKVLGEAYQRYFNALGRNYE